MPSNLKLKLQALFGCLLWDYAVPQLTWLVTCALILAPPSYRWIPACIWAMPSVLGTIKNTHVQKLLCKIAKLNRLKVLESSSASNLLRDEEETCIVGLHPHGRYPMMILPWLASRPDLFRNNFVLAQSSLGKYVPTVGLITMFCNVVDVTRKAIKDSLQHGNNVALFPGGAREMVYCQPGDKTIPIVRRNGFLRIAFEDSHQVVPCYLFGMHDAFTNPLSKFDEALFRLTGANIPFWLPTSARSDPKAMTFGEPVDPEDFELFEEFVDAYYLSLEAVFESNKLHFKEYKSRKILWVFQMESKTGVKKDTTTKLVNRITLLSSLVGAFMVSVSAFNFTLHGAFYDTARLEWYSSNVHRSLIVHIAFLGLWVLLSAIQMQKIGRFHKYVGYLAVAMNFGMCGSAFHIATKKSETTLLRDDLSNFGLVSSILQFTAPTHIAGAVLFKVVDGIMSIVSGDLKRHKMMMSVTNTLMLFALLPRIAGFVIQWIFPNLQARDRVTLANFLMYWANRDEFRSKRAKWTSLTIVLINSLLLLMEWVSGFPYIVPWIMPFVQSYAAALMTVFLKRRNTTKKKLC